MQRTSTHCNTSTPVLLQPLCTEGDKSESWPSSQSREHKCKVEFFMFPVLYGSGQTQRTRVIWHDAEAVEAMETSHLHSRSPKSAFSAPTRAGDTSLLLPHRKHQFLPHGPKLRAQARAVSYTKQVTAELSVVLFASEHNSTQRLSSAKPSRSSWLPQNLTCSIAEISARTTATPQYFHQHTQQQPAGRAAGAQLA